MKEQKEGNQQYSSTIWSSVDIQQLFTELEEPNWARWLASPTENLAGRANIFPEGQLVIQGVEGALLASLSMNRIQWDGNVQSLPSWDDVAGEPTTYEKTYNKNGNALVMMSMNVHPDYQGVGYAQKMIQYAKLTAIKLHADYILGSFRPNEFGKYKLAHLNEPVSFEQYCAMTREDGLPIDGWLRSLTRNGMKPLQIDYHAMKVTTSLSEFEEYKSQSEVIWQSISPGIWECGEVGAWHVDQEKAVYQESNLWGFIWQRTGLQ